MSGRPYLSSDDSALLREMLRGRSGRCVLEIGVGNCGNLVELSGKFELLLGTDVVRPSMEDWKGQGIDFVLADGASCVRDGSCDLVAFNPPYIADDESGDRTVEGGRKLQVPMKFLIDALRVVEAGGKVLMLLNDEAKVEEFTRVCLERGSGLRRVASKKMFFEELSVFEAAAP